MPLYLRAPLPGPFVFSHRFGGRRHRRNGPLATAFAWCLVGPVWLCWLALKWSVIGTVALVRFAMGLITGR